MAAKHELGEPVVVVEGVEKAFGAFVVLKEGASVTDRDIIEYCKGKLANYKIPRKVDFVESLPTSPSGKILRRKLRELE